jgi:hypothetical protein
MLRVDCGEISLTISIMAALLTCSAATQGMHPLF